MKTRTHQRARDQRIAPVSMPIELHQRSVAFAKKKGLPWATWVRMIIIEKMEEHELAGSRPQLRSAPVDARVASSGDRKCRLEDGTHCSVKSKAS